MILKSINIAYVRHRVESARLTYMGLMNHENDYIYSPWYVIIPACPHLQQNCFARTKWIAIREIHAKIQPTQGWKLESMHEVDTCYRDSIGDVEDKS